MSSINRQPWRPGSRAPRALFVAAALAAGAASAQPRSAITAPEIQLQSRTFAPSAESIVGAEPAEFDRVHILASFPKVVTREQIRELREVGVVVLDRCPVNAYVLSVPQALLQRGALRRALPPEARLAPLLPTDKLSPKLQPTYAGGAPKVPSYTARSGEMVEAIVLFFGDLREEGLQLDVLSRHRARPLQRLSTINGWRIAVPEEEILRLAHRDPVRWVEEGPPPPRDDNDEVRGPYGVNANAVQSAATQPEAGYGLTGAGVTIAQWETRNASVAHPDLAPRVTLGDVLFLPYVRRYRYVDGDNDKVYDDGELFYMDVDDSFSVTAGDVRATSTKPTLDDVVTASDDDVTSPQTGLHELKYWGPRYQSFVDVPEYGMYFNDDPAYFNPGEAIYLEQDDTARGKVSAGDIRSTNVARSDPDLPPYAAGSTVQGLPTADDDFGKNLSLYPDRPPHIHATHVAGTMIGAGIGNSEYRGVAPSAELISYHVKRLGLGADLLRLPDEHAAAIAAGATISNNSWGAQDYYCDLLPSDSSGYGEQSMLNDSLASGRDSDGNVATPRRLLPVFAAGNKNSFPPDCTTGPDNLWRTVQASNSAKNVLTVANVAPVPSASSAVLSDDSLRGPTGRPATPLLDGRLKPDISAPGRERYTYHAVTSTLPPSNFQREGSYGAKGGTSMATPAVSGSAALLTEWYRRACDADGPTPDLLRATLVHTAHDVQTFLEGDAEEPHSGKAFPDYGSGYGMVDVADAVKVMMHHRRGALSDDGLIEYPLSVGNVPELKVTLAWDDPPYFCLCAVSAQHGLLQNDLDVTLTDPAGNKYAPWQLDPNNPGAGAQPSGPITGDIAPYLDHRNTIEQIVVKDPMPGVWKISVSESQFNNVFPAQQFAVVSEFLSPAHGDPSYCPGPEKTDIWLRDNAADVGSTPSSMPLYYSPDVWNRVAADGGTTHQNPVAGATNYMYATLRNDRPLPSTAHAVSLELWLAPASTGLDWPQDFGLVGRLAIAQLQPGEVRTLGPIAWLVPSPQPSDHFCFYARALSPQDPIAVAETGTLATIVASSNNLAWRNVNVVDLDTAAGAPAQDIDFQVGPVSAVQGERAGASQAPIDIELIVPEALLAATRIQFSVPGELDQRWRATLSSASRPERHADAQALRPAMAADGVYQIKHPRSILFDLPLQRGERVPVRVTLHATASLGPGSYPIEIRQHQSGNVVGGIIYEATVR